MTDSRVRVVRKGDEIHLYDGDLPPYVVELERIPNKAALLQWVYHLMDKNWVDVPSLQSFVAVAAAAKGFDIHDPPV